MDGIELIGHLLDRQPDLPVLVVSGQDEAVLGARAYQAGAGAYLDKQHLGETLISTTRRLLSGSAS
jgi:DNA-binding NarL/FixJ family response regulator